MKCRWLFLILLFISSGIFSQNLTGIWRGTFSAGNGVYQENYKYEVQINQLPDNSLQGVTYSYLTTVFYGKATFEGIWFPKSNSMLLKELKLIELKIAGNSDACAMTCNLDYLKDGDKETLSGTFTSVNTSTKTDCGSGVVSLERVQESDFKKEDFLLKKKPAPKPVTQNDNKTAAPPVVNDVSKTNAKKLQQALHITADGVAGSKTVAALKSKLPGFNGKLDVSNTAQINQLIDQIKKSTTTAAVKKPASTIPAPLKPSTQNKAKPPVVAHDTIAMQPAAPEQNQQIIIPPKKLVPVPDVIKTRSNPLVKTILTSAQDIKIEIYDNGEIDGDTVTLYDNDEVIAWKRGLTDKPITINVKADANNPTHELIMVADNLGTIPPNTALMVVTTGGKRYQVYLSSDMHKNAKLIVQYNPAAQ